MPVPHPVNSTELARANSVELTGCGTLVLCLALAACSAEPPLELRGPTMGTSYTIKVVGGEQEGLRDGVDVTLARANALFSTYDPDSEISRFNAHRSTQPFEVSGEFAALALRALQLAEATGGAFDPTVSPLVDLYGFGPTERRVPDDAEIEAARARVGYGKLDAFDEGVLRKASADLEIDFSAIAKGWAVDRVADLLVERGATGFMVEIGGEVRCRGTKTGGVPWAIGIEGPGGVEVAGVVEVVELRDVAMATSGGYRNFIASGGESIHHILDPRTGRNAPSGVVSVSVRAPTCAVADALATAFMVVGPDEAERVLERLGDPRIGCLFLLADDSGDVRRRGVRW